MKLSRTIKSKFKNQRGAVAVIVAVSMVMLIGFLALAIDIGYLYATKNELQNAADAAALAAAGELGNFYTTSTDSFTEGHRSLLVTAAQSVVGSGKNTAGGIDIDIRNEDIFINSFKNAGNRFDTNVYNQPDAVRVIARRDSILNLPISTFFAKIFNIDSLPVWADATAALTGLSKVAEGGLPIPIGASVAFFQNPIFCEKPLIFHPTGDSCAGWHSFDLGPKDEFKQIKKLLEGLRDDEFVSPESEFSDTFNFNGGTNDAGYKVLDEIFQLRKGLNDGEIDQDNDSDTWTTTIVVYDAPCYINPVDSYNIVGFATIKIYGICYSGTKDETYNGYTCQANEQQVVGDITCDFVVPNRGGGGEYGTMGSIPGLVE